MLTPLTQSFALSVAQSRILSSLPLSIETVVGVSKTGEAASLLKPINEPGEGMTMLNDMDPVLLG